MSESAAANPRLSSAASPYLRSAAHQPVEWYPWGDEAFERAKREDKPILLDIGAVWCHWCHIMDGESYEDADLAKIINDRFIPVKVDRDERPDVDARYQKSVGALTGQGGWPLTAFLTPEGRVFYGGTYFPPKGSHGRPAFRDLLTAVADAFRDQKADVLSQAAHLGQHLDRRKPPTSSTAPPEAGWTAELVERLQTQHDVAHGGWGGAPKFPHPSSIEFLLGRLDQGPDERARAMVETTLDGMGAGGVYDHVAGGFHRYSVDTEWHVPHFEKMLYDNAELLLNHVHAWRTLGHARYRAKAADILRFLLEVLADRTRGGFFGSQDADVTFGDDGDFFTWTKEEIATAAGDEALAKVLYLRFGVDAQGPMHHHRAKNVLRIVADPDAIAAVLKRPLADIQRELERGMGLLRKARARRKAPFVDPVHYTNWNGMAVRALLEYADAFHDPGASAFAFQTLRRFLAEAYDPLNGFSHTLSPGSIRALLDDNAEMLVALAVAFHHSQNEEFLSRAREVADLLITRFWDEGAAAFLDRATDAAPSAAAPLSTPDHPMQDSPGPSANARACEGLLLVHESTGDPRYLLPVQALLARHAAELASAELFGAALHMVADRLSAPPPKIVVAGAGKDPRTGALLSAALRHRCIGSAVLVVTSPKSSSGLPPEAVAFAEGPARRAPGALVCLGQRCLPPVRTAGDLAEQLQGASMAKGA